MKSLVVASVCGAMAASLWLARTPSRTAPHNPAAQADQLPSSAAAPASAPAPATTAPQIPARGTPLERARQAVERGNRAEAEQKRRFSEDGWKPADAPPPDEQVTDLDPAALAGREREIQTQLQTNTYTGEMLARVAEIALKSQEDRTRFVAIESLGRSSDPRAQDELIRVYDGLTDERDRQQVLEQLLPRSAGDRATSFLLSELANPSTSASLKKQAVASLAALALAGRASFDELAQRVPADWQGEFRQIYARVRAGGGNS